MLMDELIIEYRWLNPQSMLIPIYEDRVAPGSGSADALIKTISTRVAGGRKEVSTEPSRVRHNSTGYGHEAFSLTPRCRSS